MSGRSQFLEEYIKGMNEIARRPAEEIASVLDLSEMNDILDVGGPGTYSISFLKRKPGAKATILDLKNTLKVARKIISQHPFRDRITLKSGDYHTSAFGKNRYDLILFSHVTHDEGPTDNLRLLRKAFLAARRGGQVVIHDFMLSVIRRNLYFPRYSPCICLFTLKTAGCIPPGVFILAEKSGISGHKERHICSQTDNPRVFL